MESYIFPQELPEIYPYAKLKTFWTNELIQPQVRALPKSSFRNNALFQPIFLRFHKQGRVKRGVACIQRQVCMEDTSGDAGLDKKDP
jgi:hypothetical protein